MRVTTLTHEIRIDAPIESVWSAVADLIAVERYNPMVASARYLSDQREGIGAARHCELRPRGWVEERIWEWKPPHRLGLEVAASEWPLVFMRWQTKLRGEGSGTLVHQEMTYKLKFGPIGGLMDALVMRRKLDRGVSEVFRGLKRYVENGRHGGRSSTAQSS